MAGMAIIYGDLNVESAEVWEANGDPTFDYFPANL